MQLLHIATKLFTVEKSHRGAAGPEYGGVRGGIRYRHSVTSGRRGNV